MSDLPPALRQACARELERVSRTELAARAADISRKYRAGEGTAPAISDEMDARAYLTYRLPATYAATAAAFGALAERVEFFAPTSLLDLGSGPGTASWAAAEAWPELQRIVLVDRNAHFLQLARNLSQQAAHAALRTAEIERTELLSFRTLYPFDLVVASYVVGEFADSALTEFAVLLWKCTAKALVIVEPGTPAAYRRLMRIRSLLIGQGATIAAPCPHQSACPLIGEDWCHFSQRLNRSRDHRAAKEADAPFEDEKYSYLVALRPEVEITAASGRILARPEIAKSSAAQKICGADGALRTEIVSRSDREGYKAARKSKWGDAII